MEMDLQIVPLVRAHAITQTFMDPIAFTEMNN